jgi:hydrogenase expression/formation protein HypE
MKFEIKNDSKVTMAHGGGGRQARELITGLFRKHFGNPVFNQLNDSALLVLPAGRRNICFTTDSFVVKPLFFPGGDIGKLAVCGTVNDLSVSGAAPLYISCACVIEEGFPLRDLDRIARSMKDAAAKAGVKIVTGDTKVVERGACDGIFINTAGIGLLRKEARLSADLIRPGDKVIVNGPLAEHGLAILASREGLGFGSKIASDCASLEKLTAAVLSSGAKIRFMRDPTRGGAAAVLNEIVENRDFGIMLEEDRIPVSRGARALCELLGMDPLYIANEGKVIIIAEAAGAEKILNKMYNNALGRGSRIIGEVVSTPKGRVTIRTSTGGTRILDMPSGDQLPRIC